MLKRLSHSAQHLFKCAPPCTLHVVGEFVDAVDLPARASQPGATLRPLCFEYLGGTSAPAGWPRRKPGGESRL